MDVDWNSEPKRALLCGRIPKYGIGAFFEYFKVNFEKCVGSIGKFTRKKNAVKLLFQMLNGILNPNARDHAV